MAPTPTSVLTINSGSSSVKCAVYQTGVSVKRVFSGAVDRIGLAGMTLSWRTTNGQSDEVRKELPHDGEGVSRLIDWLEARPEFAAVTVSPFLLR